MGAASVSARAPEASARAPEASDDASEWDRAELESERQAEAILASDSQEGNHRAGGLSPRGPGSSSQIRGRVRAYGLLIMAAGATVLLLTLVAVGGALQRNPPLASSPGPASAAGPPSPSPFSAAVSGPAATGKPKPALTSTPGPAHRVRTKSVTHIVRPGETLTRIAASYGVTILQIAKANKILDPNFIVTNQVLVIPPPVRPGP